MKVDAKPLCSSTLRSTPFHFFDTHDEMSNPGCLEEDSAPLQCIFFTRCTFGAKVYCKEGVLGAKTDALAAFTPKVYQGTGVLHL